MTVRQHSPIEILNAVVISELAILRARNAELSRALDVAPPQPRHRTFQRVVIAAILPALQDYSRRSYQFLKRFGPLRPLLQDLRSRIEQPKWEEPVVADSSPKDRPSLRSLTLPCVSRSFTIAFTMRSGSNEICNLLARNGLGIPNEFFQKPFSGRSDALLLNTLGRTVGRYQAHGIFGSKMAHEHRAALDAHLRTAIPGYVRLDDVLPAHRWVWLRRQDKVLQAISWCRAETSNRWAGSDPEIGDRKSFSYDFYQILSRLMMIYDSELVWDTYFKTHQVRPWVIYYEHFFQDLDHQLPALIDYLGGLPAGRSSIDKHVTYAVQRTEESYAMRKRFLSDSEWVGQDSITEEQRECLQRWIAEG